MKHILYERGHILSAFEFNKDWDNRTVLEKIRQSFGCKIPDDVSLQFLMPCGNKLVIPNLTDDKELTALMIHKVYHQKSIYLRPSRQLFEEILENTDASNIDNSDIFSDVDDSNNNPRHIAKEHGESINTFPSNFTATGENLIQKDTESSSFALASNFDENCNTSLLNAYYEIPSSSCVSLPLDNYISEMAQKSSDTTQLKNVKQFDSSMTSLQIANERSDDFTLSPHFIYNQYVECLESDTQSDISDDINLAIQSSLQDQYK
ncbi:uncharacterized protein LOC128503571 [Spea bombifrons]|uniref:uncharacterized protein LOC128503571 n=1 Tax=Spea bombifrons TaxID=233779 RepID=UPI00234AE2A9|nr:uncharacterized protein LOC128503571 [Spea bombifrons]